MTDANFKDYVLSQLKLIGGDILCRPMMGEYLLYFNGQLFGGFYNSRLLVKIVEENKQFNMEQAIPYKGAKPMYLVNELDDVEILKQIVLATCSGLQKNKK